MKIREFFSRRREEPEGPASYIPTGSTKELEATKETLPAVEIENKVLWVNPDFSELPFDIKEGEQTKLGVFLTPDKPGEKKGMVSLEVRPAHGRSALIGRVIFRDKQGRFYRDVDVKGMGHVTDNYPGLSVGKLNPEGASGHFNLTSGILRLADAFKDKETAEAFMEKGIRTRRVVAIVSIKEVIDDVGRKVGLEEARKRHLIREDDVPVLEISAYGTKMRIDDVRTIYRHELAVDPAIEDARVLVAQELGIAPKDFTNIKYINYLIEEIARNVALMHKNGWYHGYLSGHNITLDGRIIDLDSVGWLAKLDDKKRGEAIEKDFSWIHNTLNFFDKVLKLRGIESELPLENIFDRDYKKYNSISNK